MTTAPAQHNPKIDTINIGGPQIGLRILVANAVALTAVNDTDPASAKLATIIAASEVTALVAPKQPTPPAITLIAKMVSYMLKLFKEYI